MENAWVYHVEDGRSRWARARHSRAPDVKGEMIYPSFHKYDELRQQPYSAFTDRLARFLDQEGAILIVAGFSFGDEHINDIVFSALENRPRTHVYSLHYIDPAESSEIVKRALQRRNIVVVGDKTGIIGGRRAPWMPDEAAAFPSGEFEIKEEAPPSGGEPVKFGLMKIGDFARLCSFLRSMHAE